VRGKSSKTDRIKGWGEKGRGSSRKRCSEGNFKQGTETKAVKKRQKQTKKEGGTIPKGNFGLLWRINSKKRGGILENEGGNNVISGLKRFPCIRDGIE